MGARLQLTPLCEVASSIMVACVCSVLECGGAYIVGQDEVLDVDPCFNIKFFVPGVQLTPGVPVIERKFTHIPTCTVARLVKKPEARAASFL